MFLLQHRVREGEPQWHAQVVECRQNIANGSLVTAVPTDGSAAVPHCWRECIVKRGNLRFFPEKLRHIPIHIEEHQIELCIDRKSRHMESCFFLLHDERPFLCKNDNHLFLF